jgi:hypothetical protein
LAEIARIARSTETGEAVESVDTRAAVLAGVRSAFIGLGKTQRAVVTRKTNARKAVIAV